MRNQKLVKSWWIAIIVAIFSTSNVSAFPPLPSSFYGTVQQAGENIPNGTLVEALIANEVVAYTFSETYQGTSVYSLDVPGDDKSTKNVEGGKPDQIIEFRIGGVFAEQSVQWTSGVNTKIDLTLPNSERLSPTVTTYIPMPTETPIPNAIRTPSTTLRAENHPEYGNSTVEISLTATTDLIITPVEIHYKLEDHSEKGESAFMDENEDLSDLSFERLLGFDVSIDERMSTIDPSDNNDTDQTVVINHYFLWGSLSLLLLIGAIFCLVVTRRKHGN